MHVWCERKPAQHTQMPSPPPNSPSIHSPPPTNPHHHDSPQREERAQASGMVALLCTLSGQAGVGESELAKAREALAALDVALAGVWLCVCMVVMCVMRCVVQVCDVVD